MTAVACGGSYMPGANEVLGCPQIKIFCYDLRKYFYIGVKTILTIFLVIYLFVTFNKILTTFSGMPPPHIFFILIFLHFKHLPAVLHFS